MQIGLIVVANQNKKLESERFTFSKHYIQGAPRKKQYYYSFRREPKIFWKYDFYKSVLGETRQKKKK